MAGARIDTSLAREQLTALHREADLTLRWLDQLAATTGAGGDVSPEDDAALDQTLRHRKREVAARLRSFEDELGHALDSARGH